MAKKTHFVLSNWCIHATHQNVVIVTWTYIKAVFSPGPFSIAAPCAFHSPISLMWEPKRLMWSQTPPKPRPPASPLFYPGENPAKECDVTRDCLATFFIAGYITPFIIGIPYDHPHPLVACQNNTWLPKVYKEIAGYRSG